jgi:quinol monooxygenase YgiN
MFLTDQPAHILKMRAKPGMGDRLFELASVSLKKANASDRFILFREDADPDVMWNIEVYRSVAAKNDYESSPLADELRNDVLDLLVGPPLIHVEGHVYSAIPALSGNGGFPA